VHALLGRAKALCDEGNQQRAIAAFSKAISLQPDLAEAYHGRGLARQDAGENDLAIADFTKAIDLRPDFTEALNARGLTHLLKCDYARTKRDLREVIKLDPYGETGASAKENLELLGPQ
jgi:tetratricopeptide (TPR) repeat protein